MRHELRTMMAQLTPQNRKTIRRMVRYMDSYSLNEVSYEELLSDLIGMALESQERGQPFAQAVGMDEAVFCHELVTNCLRQTRTERVLSMLLFLAAWVSLLLPAMCLLEWWFPWMPGECDGLLYAAPASILCKYVATVVMVAVGVYFFKRITYRSKSLVGGLYLLAFILVFIAVSEISPLLIGRRVLHIHLLVWCVACAGVMGLLYAVRRCAAMTVAYQRKKQQMRERDAANADSMSHTGSNQ